MSNRVLLVASVLATALCGCSLANGRPSESSQPVTRQNIDQICGREWRITEWRMGGESVALAPDSQITLRCDAKLRVSGNATINRYFAQLSIDDAGLVFWPGPGFGVTKMAGPPELMDQEQRYLQALGSINGMALLHGTLMLTGNAGDTRLVFAPIGSVQAEALIGVWLRPIRNAPPGIDTLEGLHFLPEGIVQLIGIYSMNGLTWTLDGERLTITTNTERYPEPHALHYVITALNDESLVMAGEDYLAGSYTRASQAPAQPLAASRAAAIDANLQAYDKLSGELTMGDAAATFEAYFYDDTLRHIDERIDQGDYGRTENRFYLGAEGLFYYRSESDLVAAARAHSNERDRTLLIIAYDDEGKIDQALKVVNGETVEPGDEDLMAPKRRLAALHKRIDELSGGPS
jgi:heat shock protein HslJ